MSEAKYDAFISYRRSDGATVARWLRRELEAFRPPKSLRKKFAAKLRIYQDTAYERGTSDFYDMSIRPALLGSRFLLVVATPDAVLRPKGEDWIKREVEDFTAGPNARNVVAVRAAGEFNDPLPADLAARFPNIEIVDLRGASRFWFLNPAKASRLTNEKLKLIAPLIGLPGEDMPKLRQEEEKRQQARLGAAAGVTLAVLIAVSAASIFAIISRDRAKRALESSMFAAGRMVTSLSPASLSVDAALPKSNGFVREACDLIDKLSAEADRPPNAGALVACRIARGAQRVELGESGPARAEFQHALDIAKQRHKEAGGQDAGYWIVQAHLRWIAFLKKSGDAAAVESALSALEGDAKSLSSAHEAYDVFPRAEAEALRSLADIAKQRNLPAEAARGYDGAASAVARAVEIANGRPATVLVDWLARLHRLAGEQSAAAGDDAGAVERFGKAVEARSQVKPADDVAAAFDQELAVTLAMRSDAQKKLGRADLAKSDDEAALAAIERVLGSSHSSADEKLRAREFRDLLAERAGSKTAEP